MLRATLQDPRARRLAGARPLQILADPTSGVRFSNDGGDDDDDVVVRGEAGRRSLRARSSRAELRRHRRATTTLARTTGNVPPIQCPFVSPHDSRLVDGGGGGRLLRGSRGFAASALFSEIRPTQDGGGGGGWAGLITTRSFASSAAGPLPPHSSTKKPAPPPPPTPAAAPAPATSSLSSSPYDDVASAAKDKDLDAGPHTMDLIKEDIDRGARVLQLEEAQSMFAKVFKAFKALGPYTVSCLKMSRAEWRVAFGNSWTHIKDEVGHHWMGTKLLWVEVKIAFRLLLKTLRGEPLSRRERRQMTRTTADVFRLVPFAVFVLIPLMEVLLPVAVALFPSMLPTTFRKELQREEELKKRLKAKMEVARFLQDTVKVGEAKGKGRGSGGFSTFFACASAT